MAGGEELGSAVLRLTTDDTAFTGGVTNAKGKAEELGKVLDATSGSSVNLAEKMADTGKSGEILAAAFTKAGEAMDQLAAAQVRAKAEIANAKASLDAGDLSLEAYNRQVLETKAGLAQFEEAHRRAQTELRTTLTSTAALTGATAGQKAGMMQLTQQLGDMSTMYAMGARPQQIFASQISQVSSAMQLMAGEGTRLGTFLANPWVLAVTTATIILGPLAAGLLSSKDAADEAGKSSQTWADKLDASKHSIDQVIAALREYNAEQKKANETTLEAAAAAAKAAADKLKEAIAERQRLAALLDSAYSQMDNPRNAEEASGASIEVRSIQSKIAANTQVLNDLSEQARQAVTSVAEEMAKLDSDPTAKIRAGFTRLRTQAKDSIADVNELRKRLAELNTQEAAAIKAEQERKKAANSKGSSGSGSQASVGDMVALVRQLFPGAAITSTTGGRHVKGSDHYASRAIDFVPAGGMGQYSTADVRRILTDAGVDIRRNAQGVQQLFGPGDKGHNDHFHFAWQGSASPESAQRKAQQAADEAARNQQAFNNEAAQLNQQLLAAKAQGLTSADAIAESQRAQVQAEADREAQSIAAAVKSHKYTEAQGQLLTALNASVAAVKLERIKREQVAARITRSVDLQTGLLGNELDVLRTQENSAKTAEDRRRIALQILDYETKIARLKLQETIDLAWVGKASAEQARIAQDALSKLNAGADAQREQVMEQTAGPLESYINGMKMNRAQRGERVQQLIVDELEYVEQNMTDAISKRLGVKDPLLKGLIEMFIEQQLVKPFAQALQNLMSQMGGGGSGGIFGTILSGISSALGGGSSLSAAGIAASNTTVDATISEFSGYFAEGGTIPAGSWGIAGEAGPEPIFGGSSGVSVMSNPDARSMFGTAAASGPDKLEVNVSGARGNAEIEEMVRSGVAQGLATYDLGVGERVQDWLDRRK